MIHWFQENIVTRCLDECYLEPLPQMVVAGVSRWKALTKWFSYKFLSLVEAQNQTLRIESGSVQQALLMCSMLS